MAATTLPIVASAAPPTAPAATRGASPVAATAAAANSTGSQGNGDAAPNDFLAMFAQMISTVEGVAENAAPELSGDRTADKAGDKTADKSSADAQSADALAAAVLQPFAAPIQLPVQPAPAPQQKTDVMQLVDAQLSATATDAGTTQKTILEVFPESQSTTEKNAGKTDAAQAQTPTQMQPQMPTPMAAFSDPGAVFNAHSARSEPQQTVQIHAPVGSQHWPDQVGAQLTLMAQKGEHSASLKLSPEHLGPLEVRIAVRDDQTTVWFSAQHADTRAAIEQALPRLRELFAAQGMSLGDSGVYREAPRDTPKPFTSGQSSDKSADVNTVSVVTAVRTGLVDAYV